MSSLKEIIAHAEKTLKLKADIRPERMKILEDVMKGKISPTKAKELIQKQFDDAEEE